MNGTQDKNSKEEYGYIYKIPFPNGKNYIGLTMRTLERRKIEHKHAAKINDPRYLYKAIRKYNMIDTFELIEIDTAETQEELCKKEIEYIKKYESYYKKKGYNMTYGGEGATGYEYTQEEKDKMSERLKQYLQDNPEARDKMSERMKQYYKDNPEAKKKGRKCKPFDIFLKEDGTYVASFDYQFEANKYLQENYNIKGRVKIGVVLRGIRKSSHGFIFKYKSE
mgnify:CR=1 FL=1